MNEEKKSTGNASKKSSRATAQKSPGEKLKNEQSARKAVREKLRYGKKDNSLTLEQQKKLKAKQKKSQKLSNREAVARRQFHEKLNEANEDDNVAVEATSRGVEGAGLAGQKVRSDMYRKKLYTKAAKESEKLESAKKQTSAEMSKKIQKSRTKREMIDAYQKKKAKEAAGSAGGVGKKFLDKAGDMVGRIGEFDSEHILQNPKVLVIAGIIALIIIVIGRFGWDEKLKEFL